MGDRKVKTCSSCGEAVEIDAAFCTNCGSRFMENTGVKHCSSCGETTQRDDAFCTRCGSRLEEKGFQAVGGGSAIGTGLMELANDFLSVRAVSSTRFEFSSQTGAQAPAQKIKVKYDAVAQLDPEKKLLTFWERMVESAVGMDTGSYSEKTVQKGTEVSKKIHGHPLFGGKYGFEYGKLREVVKAIAGEQGWTFKALISEPRENSDRGDVSSRKSMTVLKILVPVLALLLILALGVIGYLIFSGRSGVGPPLVQQPTPTSSQTTPGNSDPGNAGEANKPYSTDSHGRKVLRQQGAVAGGKPLIETDRNSYNEGEEIIVYYYNAPGYSRDWICIVPAGSLNTEAGDYQYIPRKGRGVLTFRSLPQGRYEARAYYNYSAGRYVVSARYGFTVKNR